MLFRFKKEEFILQNYSQLSSSSPLVKVAKLSALAGMQPSFTGFCQLEICRLSEISTWSIQRASLITGIIRSLLRSAQSFLPILSAKLMELHQSLHVIKGSLSIGGVMAFSQNWCDSPEHSRLFIFFLSLSHPICLSPLNMNRATRAENVLLG